MRHYSVRADMELVSEQEISSIIKRDSQSKSITTDSKRYEKSNLFSYYLIINLWLLIIRKWSAYGWIAMKEAIQNNGLIPTIGRCSTYADSLIRGQSINDNLCGGLLHDIESFLLRPSIPDDESLDVNWSPISAALFIFRFPKRFSPQFADVITAKGISDFLQIENRNKLMQRNERSRYIINHVKRVIANDIDWDRFITECNKLGPEDYIITPGVSRDARSYLLSKIQAIVSAEPKAVHPIFGYTSCNVPRSSSNGDDTVSVRAVPKSYKASRIIAMENTYRQARAKRIFTILDKCLPHAINLHDQTQNQQYAYSGAMSGDYATIDLSSASDTITKTLLKELIPQAAFRIIDTCLAHYTEIDGKARSMQMASTAGNALTFSIECIVFYGIVRAAVDIGYAFDPHDVLDVSVYGDDIICPTRYAQIVMEWLGILGFIVNTEKSYTSPTLLYRESCGVEFYEGINTSVSYYPRTPIQGFIKNNKVEISDAIHRDGFRDTYYDSTSSLISLQHSLYFTCYDASMFVFFIVREACPEMTCSPAGENCSDLWGYYNSNVQRKEPYGKFLDNYSKEFFNGSIRKYHDGELLWYKRKLKTSWVVSQEPVHMAPVARSYANEEEYDANIDIINQYRYHYFLKYGPQYSDPLSELLGVSDRILPKETFFKVRIAWTIR